MADHVAGAPLEKPHHFVDHGAVVPGRLIPHAGRLAPLDEVIETGSLRGLARQRVVARAYREDTLHHIERAAHRAYIRIRAEIPCAVLLQSPRDDDTGKRFLHRHLDVGIRFVITQRDVESRTVLLDERRFENERMRLAGNHDRVEVLHLAQQASRLRAGIVVLRPVASHARAEALRLAHVQHPAIGILPEVHPRGLRQVWQSSCDRQRHAPRECRARPLVVGHGQIVDRLRRCGIRQTVVVRAHTSAPSPRLRRTGRRTQRAASADPIHQALTR